MRKRCHHILSLLLILLIVATGALSCKNHPAKPSISIVMADYFNSWLSTYAIREGVITSDKVDVNIVLAVEFDTQMIAGNFPMGAMATSKFAITCELNKLKFKGISTCVVHEGAEKQEGVNVLFAKAGSTINSPADLIGKKVGVPDLSSSATSVFLGMLKQDYGISEDQLVLVDRANPLLLQLLRQGEVDVAMLGGNISPQAYIDPALKVVWNLDKAFYAKYDSVFFPSMLVVEEGYYAKHADIVRAAYELMQASNTYGEQHLVELSTKYAAEYGQTADFYQYVFKNHSRNKMLPITGKAREALMATFDMVRERGIIASLPNPDVVFVSW